MTKAQKLKHEPKTLYREIAHDYPFLWWILGFEVFVSLLVALALYTTHPQENEWQLIITIPSIIGTIVTTAYFMGFPITVEVTKSTLVLRRGGAGSLRDRSVPLASISALRRIAYSKKLHGGLDVRGADLECWNMGGSQVLEIEMKDADRIHLALPNVDRLTALLHEMTRVPVEDCQ